MPEKMVRPGEGEGSAAKRFLKRATHADSNRRAALSAALVLSLFFGLIKFWHSKEATKG
jgi:hypothetical protein